MSENRGIAPFPEDYDNVKRGHNYFVGIGINTYQHFTKLHNARKDVEDVADLLCESFHFERKHMTLLLDGDATRKRIIKTISDLRHKISEDDSLLIYYSGHGFMSGGLGYWIPIEAAKDEEDEFVSNSDIRDKIKEIKARHTLLISDSCFSASLLVRDASREVSGSFDTWEKQKSRWVVISGKGIVSDGEQGKNSPFANAILKNLKNASDDKINIVKLADEVTKSVGYNYEQQAECSPLFGVGHDGGQFVFHKKHQNKEELVWKDAEKRNTETAYLHYLQQFPNGKYYEIAKQNMKTLAEEKKWKVAHKEHSIIAYWEFLEIYGTGKFAEKAKENIELLKAKESSISMPNIIIPKEQPIIKLTKLETDSGIEMIFVEGGTFLMGSKEYEREKPIHQVSLDSFFIGKYPVTQKQWRTIMGKDPDELFFKGCDGCPVERVSWNDVQDFLAKLNQKTGKNYRLPTEAEWEYAARGGKQSKGYEYAGSNTIDNVAQYEGNNNKSTKSVGSKSPNELGIYDMSGNVWEWCNDWYDENYYKNSPANNPTGATNGEYRVLRGGSWYNLASYCRVADRNFYTPDNRYNGLGFRLALSQ